MAQTTKKVLGESLKKLAQEKSFDKITVVDIVKDCEINRQTFYYHFQDIHDLLEWVFLDDNKEELEGKLGYYNWQQGYWKILCYIKENRNFIKSIYYSSSREIMTRFMNKITYQFLMEGLEDQTKDICVKEEDKAFIANFYKCALVGLILDWIGSGMREDPQKLVEKLSILIHGDVLKGLKRFRINKKLDIEL